MKVFFSLHGKVPRKEGILFCFAKPEKKPEIPYCYFNYPQVLFGNISSEGRDLGKKEERFLIKLFFNYFNNATSWQALKCIDSFTCRGVSREETFLERQFLLTIFLESYREIFSFYSAFFFLYFFHNEYLVPSPSAEINLRLRSGLRVRLELWEIFAIPGAAYCMVLDYSRDFLSYASKSKDKRLLINNLIGHLMSLGKLSEEMKNFKKLLQSRGLILPLCESNLSEAHGGFSAHSRILSEKTKGV